MKNFLRSSLVQEGEPSGCNTFSTSEKKFSRGSNGKLSALLCLALALPSLNLHAAPIFNTVVLPDPLACGSHYYQNIFNALKILDLDTGVYNDIGQSTNKYNAMGWDQRTDLLYAIDAINKDLLVIGNTGVGVSLGVPRPRVAGTAFTHKPYAGTMDASGNLWVHGRDHKDKRSYKGFKINVETKLFEVIRFRFTNFGIMDTKITDFVYVESTNAMWGLGPDSNLYKFDLNNQTVTRRAVRDLPVDEEHGYGAAFTFNDGSLYFSANSEGAIYKINDYEDNPVATFFVGSESTSNNDGATCPLADPPTIEPPIIEPPLPPKLSFGESGRFNLREINSHIVRQTEGGGGGGIEN